MTCLSFTLTAPARRREGDDSSDGDHRQGQKFYGGSGDYSYFDPTGGGPGRDFPMTRTRIGAVPLLHRRNSTCGATGKSPRAPRPETLTAKS
jgi:hypothetical protein